MKKTLLLVGAFALMTIAVVAAGFQKPSFGGDWVMDQDRSFGLPPNVKQKMKVSHTGDQIDLETRIINPHGEDTIKDSYVVDGKERDFTPQGPKGPIPGAKGKRTATWMANGRGILVNEETTTETPKGVVAGKMVRKWTMSNEGELVIDMYVDNPNISYEMKRIFKKSVGQ